MFQWSDDFIRQLLDQIFNGQVTEYNLPENLYFAIADYLKKGLYEGFGISHRELALSLKKGLETAFDETDFELLDELRDNIYMFSAAKTYQQVVDTRNLLATDEGVSSFSDFKKGAEKIFTQYNENWLQTEYNTAIGQAQMAVKWNDIEKHRDILPYLKYSAVEDPNTSDICRPLDGVTLPIDHAFWHKFMPLNHFNCRCTVQQLSKNEGEGQITDPKEVRLLTYEVGDEMQDNFKMNPGVDKVIFNNNHPYFSVTKKDRAFAKQNFGLSIPPEDKEEFNYERFKSSISPLVVKARIDIAYAIGDERINELLKCKNL